MVMYNAHVLLAVAVNPYIDIRRKKIKKNTK